MQIIDDACKHIGAKERYFFSIAFASHGERDVAVWGKAHDDYVRTGEACDLVVDYALDVLTHKARNLKEVV